MKGKILYAELSGCSFKEIDSEERILAMLSEIADKCRMNVLKTISHKFEPHGITAVSLIAESHIAVHTWPELGYMSVLIHTCGETDPEEAIPVLKKLSHSFFSFRRL